MSSKTRLSKTQLVKETRHRSLQLGTGARVVCRHLTGSGDEGVDILEWPWDETRCEEWGDEAVEQITAHAESLGAGIHRYAVRGEEASGKQRSVTWCRVHVAREPHATGSSDETPSLDGSAESFMRTLQSAYEEERKARHETLRMVNDVLQAQSRTLQAVLERQTMLERERTERLVADAERPPAPAPEESAPTGADMFALALTTMGPAIGAKLGETIAAQLGPMVGQLAPTLGKLAEQVAGGMLEAPASLTDPSSSLPAVADVPVGDLPS